MIVPAKTLDTSDAAQLRKKARFRCTLWAGCGFGTLGHLPAAMIGSLVLWLWLGSFVWFCLELTNLTFWIAVALSVLTIVFWTVEYFLLGRLPIVPERFFQRHWLKVAGLGYMGIAVDRKSVV